MTCLGSHSKQEVAEGFKPSSPEVSTALEQPFWPQGPVSGKTIFPRMGAGDGLGMIQVYYIYCAFIELHLRSSGIRSRRWGTPVLEDTSIWTEASGCTDLSPLVTERVGTWALTLVLLLLLAPQKPINRPGW